MLAREQEKFFSEVLVQDLTLLQVNKQILKVKKQADLHPTLMFISAVIRPASILAGDTRDLSLSQQALNSRLSPPSIGSSHLSPNHTAQRVPKLRQESSGHPAPKATSPAQATGT